MTHSKTPLSPGEFLPDFTSNPDPHPTSKQRSYGLLAGTSLLLLTIGVCGHAYIIKTEPGIGLLPMNPVELETPDEAPRILHAKSNASTVEIRMRGTRHGIIEEIEETIPITGSITSFRTPFDGCETAHISVTGTNFHGASIPFHSGSLPSFTYWTEGFLAYEHPDDIADARIELQSIHGLTQAKNTLQRLETLFTYLQKELTPHWGDPKPEHRKVPGLAMMALARRQGAKLDCGPSSLILAAYANLAGLPTRIVSLMGERGDLAVGRHTMTEHWDRDTNRWILSDMVNGVVRFDTSTSKGVSLYRAMTTWRSVDTHGLYPVLEAMALTSRELRWQVPSTGC